ncbi:MAG: DUF438 domain-containing protein [Ignavibacteria bacterium]|jgi:hypothetical protein|nr:DUF438 domain-containing protein [Ignavibacteria bacterium]
MSELINNSSERIRKLKSLLLKLHQGSTAEDVKAELISMLGSVPYGEVVQAEQELIDEGIPSSEIQKYCDLHSQALKDNIDLTYEKKVPEGHPVHTMKMENRAIETELAGLQNIFIKVKFNSSEIAPREELLKIRTIFNHLMDIEKHYVKKENIFFPILEKYGITGPSTVMWAKNDEVRGFLKSSLSLSAEDVKSPEALQGFVDLMFAPAAEAVREMIVKEEKILFPMCLDKFTEIDWYNVYLQSRDVGYCLFVPSAEWHPEGIQLPEEKENIDNRIRFDTGSFSVVELESLLNCIPFDITFVDKDDSVKFFSHGKQRIFERSKAILGRQVQYCHPPSSVHIVDKILGDFKSGRQSEAKFWIPFKGMFVHIAYYAVRDKAGNYLGTAEITQDITHFKKAEGERRLLTYDE